MGYPGKTVREHDFVFIPTFARHSNSTYPTYSTYYSAVILIIPIVLSTQGPVGDAGTKGTVGPPGITVSQCLGLYGAIQKWLTFRNQFWRNTEVNAKQIPDVFIKD